MDIGEEIGVKRIEPIEVPGVKVLPDAPAEPMPVEAPDDDRELVPAA